MDSFEWTKIAGAVLAALLLIFGFKTIIEMRQHKAAEAPGYTLPGGEAPAAKTAESKPAEAKPVEGGQGKDAAAPPAVAAKEASAAKEVPKDAPVAKDAQAAKDPAAAPAKDPAAPAPAASAAGGGEGGALLAKANAENGAGIFKKCATCHTYEKGKGKAIGPNLWGVVNRPKASFEGFEYSADMKAKGGNWTFADLTTFVTKPKAYVPGTKMVFNGLSNPEDVADVVAYLATLADTPVPLPK